MVYCSRRGTDPCLLCEDIFVRIDSGLMRIRGDWGVDRRFSAWMVLGIGTLAAGYAFFVEPRWVEWNDEDVDIPGLSPAMDGFRVFHLTDLHLYSGLSASVFRSIVNECNRQKPDLVVLTGDLVNHSAQAIPGCVAQLGELRARCGVLAILGGHDYESFSAARLISGLESVGIRVLHNRAVPVGSDESPLWVAGIDDNTSQGHPDLDAALAPIPEHAPRILLMHSPDGILQAARHGVPLVLAGHTHGGQVCLPFLGPVRTMSRYGKQYARGRCKVGETTLYTSRGLGSHHRVRFLARPEVVRFRLRSVSST